jgi:hypothetical protein
MVTLLDHSWPGRLEAEHVPLDRTAFGRAAADHAAACCTSR